MAYETVYDWSQTWAEGWYFIPFGLIFCVLGVHLVLPHGWLQKVQPVKPLTRSQVWGRWFVLPFAVFWTGMSAYIVVSNYRRFHPVMRDGTCRMIEGRVENFVAGRGRRWESFAVAGVPFAYRDRVISGGFHHASGSGGPIRADLAVRICYWPDADLAPGEADDGRGNVILRLEIAKG